MIEILKTNNPVTLSFAVDVLAQIGVEALILDHHMSIVEGSIGIIPRRLMVERSERERAVAELRDAGLEDELVGR